MNPRLRLAVAGVLFFAVIVLVWYFFYAKPIIAPSLAGTKDPFPTLELPPRLQFLTWGNDDISTSSTEITDPTKIPLIRIWDKPATGQTFVRAQILKEVQATTTQGTSTRLVTKTIRASTTVLMFIDRVTGYIYGHGTESGKTYQISNTLIPGVHDAYFFDNGRRVIIRYADRDKNTIVALIANTPVVQEEGTPLPLEKVAYLTSQVLSVTINSRKDKASYLVSTDEGSAIYTVLPKGEPTFLTSSPFKEWSLAYGGETLYATTKPSAYVEGVTMRLPLFNSEINGKTGLMTSPGESTFLSSMWGKSGLATFTVTNNTYTVMPFTTLAPKCTWGERSFLICAIPRSLPKATEGLPDDWLQGRVSFSDDLFVINPLTGEQFPFYAFSESDGVFDITNIHLDTENRFITFNRKQDGSLWRIDALLLNKGE